MTRPVLLCSCLDSQTLDAGTLSKATGRPCSKVHRHLCGDNIGVAAKAISAGEVTIACEQERATFEALAEDLRVEPPDYVDLRDRAGWTDAPGGATAKQAALLAEASLPVPPARTLDVVSHGTCLVIGASDIVLPLAERLSTTLAVTVLLTDGAPPPDSRAFDVIHGRVRRAEGALGRFRVTIDGLRQVIAGGRGGFAMTAPKDGGISVCDIILDLSGGTPLFPAAHKREGYFRADPRRPAAIEAAAYQASHATGTFELPLYVRLEPSLCAHSRARQTGCTRCVDACPTGAIRPDGDRIAVDPHVCAGCGACSALCPSGAIAYDAPPTASIFRRLTVLAEAFRNAGGGRPRLLVHDGDHGRELIALLARHGAGLPPEVIPFHLDSLTAFGHAEALAALAAGFADVSVLLAPRTDRQVLDHEVCLTAAIAGCPAMRLLDVADPDALPETLGTAPAHGHAPALPMGSRRQVTRLAARTLGREGQIPLPDGAPYGAVILDTGACTLCLACVPLCPSRALGDNPDLPQLLFQEDACLQCGLCASICPENAITYEPRLNLADEALTQVVLHEEEPFACIECGTLFGVKSTIERISTQLAGRHAMFANENAARMIRMCDDCRVAAQYHSTDNPFTLGQRPKPRTAADYLSEREDG